MSSRKYFTKKLTLNNQPIINHPDTIHNNITDINIASANIKSLHTHILTSDYVNATQTSIGGLNVYENSTACYLNNQSNSNKLIIKNNNIDTLSIADNNNVVVETNLEVNGNGNFLNDINANNINLLGNIISTNNYITNDSIIDGKSTMNHGHILNDLYVDGTIITRIINSNIMNVKDSITTDLIETKFIKSCDDLNIQSGINCTVNIPNIRYNTNIDNLTLINPISIKSTKIFVVTQNVFLQADETCDGIEIIIYNKNIQGHVILRDTTNIIDKIHCRTATKIVYILCANTWVKL